MTCVKCGESCDDWVSVSGKCENCITDELLENQQRVLKEILLNTTNALASVLDRLEVIVAETKYDPGIVTLEIVKGARKMEREVRKIL